MILRGGLHRLEKVMRRKSRLSFCILLLVGSMLALPALAEAQKLVFVARHAERADEPARNQEDPVLSAAGEARAARLNTMLRDADIKAIFVTQYKRTQLTARPLAQRLKLTPQVMPPSVGTLVNELKSRHEKDVVLIVAHASTIPGIIKGLGGSSHVDMDDSVYDSFFVVVPATGAVATIHY
jgi:phosphohistidine phosphatase SixA